jgi:acyl-CoA thioester hydrolase
MPSGPTFTLAVRVGTAQLDGQRHVNNVAFVRYVQEAAYGHWLAAAPPEVRSAVTWVVRRHEIDYLKPAFLDDELLLSTWVGEPSAATWERFTEISRPADGQLLVKARTVWVLLDAATGRPRRIDTRLTGSLRGFGPPVDRPAG